MGDWRTIDSAPKDGREILGMFRGRRIIMKWADMFGDLSPHAGWQGVGVVWYDGRGTITDLRDGWGEGGPTHWQPLPDPPQ